MQLDALCSSQPFTSETMLIVKEFLIHICWQQQVCHSSGHGSAAFGWASFYLPLEKGLAGG